MIVNKTGFNIYPRGNALLAAAPADDTPRREQSVSTLPRLPLPYYVSFGAKKNDDIDVYTPSGKRLFIKNNSSYNGAELLNNARNIAQKYGHREINQLHVMRAALESLDKYIGALNSGEKMYGEQSSYSLYIPVEEEVDFDIFKNKNKRALIRPVIKDGIKDLDDILQKIPAKKTSNRTKPVPANDFINDIYSIYIQKDDDEVSRDGLIHDGNILMAAMYPCNDKILEQFAQPFRTKLKDAVYIDREPASQRVHLSFYDNKATDIWKKLAVGTNTMILHDKKTNPRFLVNSFLDVFAKSEKGFGHLKPQNTKIIDMHNISNFDSDYMHSKLHEYGKDKNTNYIIVTNIMNNTTDTIGLCESDADILKEVPRNIKFVMLSNKDKYYSNYMEDNLKGYFQDFAEVSIPIMNMAQAKNAFFEQPKLSEKIKKSFSKASIAKCVEASNQLEGNYPEKAQKVMALVAGYYTQDKISADDVVNYTEEAKEIFKSQDNNASLKLLLDTGIKFKDMIGVSATKKEAKSIVDQIKTKSLGTKGFIIYSQDGSVGAGRKYTARAIAGEAKIPYIEINAVDFGTEKVSIFDDNSSTPEASMKKLFGMVKAQAETNPSKSAVLFIENFEYFSVGEFVSEYHEKAMSQLIREMNRAQEQGFNIAVVGSTGDPDMLGESTTKSFKFIDKIEVESPAYNRNARREIINYYVKHKGIKLAGATPQEKDNIVENIIDTTDRFSFIEILTLLDKAKNVAKERTHKEINKSDFTEAYLQLTTGRPSSRPISDDSKKIVTSHECGHALNYTVMFDLAKKAHKSWVLGERVNFIALDPRGSYLGAVYSKSSYTDEYTFEQVFAGIVSSFGGNSCENKLYGFDGSWGITADMGMATRKASIAVTRMGLGKHFGKKSLEGTEFLSDKDSELINADIDVMLKNAQTVSDLITDTYEGFIREFTDKYYNKVGTGECLITGETFEKELYDWKSKQPSEKQREFEAADELILEIIQACKTGKINL